MTTRKKKQQFLVYYNFNKRCCKKVNKFLTPKSEEPRGSAAVCGFVLVVTAASPRSVVDKQYNTVGIYIPRICSRTVNISMFRFNGDRKTRITHSDRYTHRNHFFL